MRRFVPFALALAVLLASWFAVRSGASSAAQIASLIDPAKLATLRERGANPRVQKYVAILAEARIAHLLPEQVVTQAVTMAGMKSLAAALTADTMLRNLEALVDGVGAGGVGRLARDGVIPGIGLLADVGEAVVFADVDAFAVDLEGFAGGLHVLLGAGVAVGEEDQQGRHAGARGLGV